MSECKLYGRNRPDMYLFTHEQILSTVNEAYSYGEHGIDTADFRIKCEDFGPNFVQERTCHVKDLGGLPGMIPLLACDFCGEPNYARADGSAWNYCPNCGSKVIVNERIKNG